MKKLIGSTAVIVSCAAFSSVAVGEDEKIEEVQVWGTKVYASSVITMDESAMAIRQADHISDLLRTVPGVDVGGAHSLNQRITVRSMDDKDLGITIDGANQNTYMYHHMGNLQIHADILKTVELEVGNNSVVNAGLGGSVRFETRDAKDLLAEGSTLGGRAQVSVSDNASNTLSLTGYAQLSDTVDMLAYYNLVDRANYRVGGGKILDENGETVAGTDGEVRGLDGELSDALLKIGWDLGENQRIKLGYESYADKGDYSYRPDMGLATDLAIAESLGIDLVYPTEFTRETLTLNYALTFGDSSQLTAAIYQNKSTFWRNEQGLAAWQPAAATTKEGYAENSGFNVLAETALTNHTLVYGADLVRYQTAYTASNIEVSSESATSSAVFVQDTIALGAGFSVIPGVRYNAYSIDANLVDSRYSKLTKALAANYRFADHFLLSLSTTELFKAPELAEVFVGAGVNDAANSNIDAETGTNTELSFAFDNNVFAAGATVFDTNIDSYIYDYAVNAEGVQWKDNVGDMAIQGFELYGEYTVGNLTALLSFSSAESELSAFAEYNRPDDETTEANEAYSLDGAREERQQGDTWSFNLDYVFREANINVHWEFMLVDGVPNGSDLGGANSDTSKDGFSVHNVSLLWQPSNVMPGLSVAVGVDNLFDEFYSSQSSKNGLTFHPRFQELYLKDYEPGRNVKATVAYRF